MSAFHLLIIFFWLPGVLVLKRNILATVYLWQTKEYRFDRVLSHYRNEYRLAKSQQIIVFVKIGIFTSLIIYLLAPSAAVLLVSLPIVFIVYLNEGILFLESVIAKKFLRPSLKSIRNLLLIAVSLFIMLLPLAVLLTLPDIFSAPEGTLYRGFTVKYPENSYDLAALLPREVEGVLVIPLVMVALVFSALFMLAADNLGFLAVTLGVVLTEPLALIRRHLLVIRARNLIRLYPKIKIVGITGSYGKSTTKELLYQLVKQKFKAVVTPKNYNTAVGIASVILKQVKKTTEVFIAEMGAYTQGEVAQSAKLVPPDIAIITGIEEQHLSLFGSIENILQAKYEVIEYMRPDGLAIFNGDNEYCLRLAEKTTRRKKIYFTVNDYNQIMTETIASGQLEDGKTQFPINENTYARDLVLTRKGINFELHSLGDVYKVSTNLPAKYYVANLLAAVMAANELGLSIKEIVGLINKTEFNLPYLNIYQGINNSKIIDDGYNANVRGMLAALDFLHEFKFTAENAENTQIAESVQAGEFNKVTFRSCKKGVMTQGIIELGDLQKNAYKKIAQKLIKSADYLITTDKILAEAVQKESDMFVCRLVDAPARLAAAYESLVTPGDLVLVEGAMPKLVLDRIYQNQNKS